MVHCVYIPLYSLRSMLVSAIDSTVWGPCQNHFKFFVVLPRGSEITNALTY